MGKVGKQSNTITELSKTVEVLKHFSASLDKDHREMVNGGENYYFKFSMNFLSMIFSKSVFPFDVSV